MSFYIYFRDELISHSNTIPSFFFYLPPQSAHPSSPINVKQVFKGNGQEGAVVFVRECIPSPPSEAAPLDITQNRMVECENGVPPRDIFVSHPVTSLDWDILRNSLFPHQSLSTIPLSDVENNTQNNTKSVMFSSMEVC